MPNMNEKTQIPYGVLAANDVPFLFDDITMHGDNLSHEQLREDVQERLEDAIQGVVEDYTHKATQIVKNLDVAEILDALECHGLWDSYITEEEEYAYEYEHKGKAVKLLVSWLGGAPLIWVLESPFITYCRPCSPCVPGAGDLNSPDADGMVAHCLPPEDMPEDWQGNIELLEAYRCV